MRALPGVISSSTFIRFFTPLLFTFPAVAAEPGQFVDITLSAGVAFEHQTTQTILTSQAMFAAPESAMDETPRLNVRAEISSSWFTGGVAVGDYDGDQLPDIFAVGGDAGLTRLFRNNGNGTFTDKAAMAGVAITGERLAGVMFVDYDGDDDLDIFVGGLVATKPRLFRNDGENEGGETTFTDVFDATFPNYDLFNSPNNYGGSLGDFDLDGDLDFIFAHSMSPYGPRIDVDAGDTTQHLWRNDGNGGGSTVFTDVSIAAGISVIYTGAPPASEGLGRDESFSPNFTDLNEDGYPDLLIASDIGDSLVLINDKDGTFSNLTNTDQFTTPNNTAKVSAMGAAIGDYNNDGHFDWFVSQIRWSFDGNRLYQGQGTTELIDMMQVSGPFPAIGMESGHWGWGACFADLDNDQHLDIFHVNGLYYAHNPLAEDELYSNKPAVAFISNADGSFTERGAEIGLADIGEGRGVSCFDFDRDGDIDIAISNHRGPFKLYENTLINTPTKGPAEGPGFVTVTVSGIAPNTSGVGSRIVLRSSNASDSGPEQLMRQISVDANFVSSNLSEAHFGVGDWQGPFELEVTWPDRQVTVHSNITRNSFVDLTQPPFDRVFSTGFE